MIEVKTFVFSPFSENTYVAWEKESRQAAIIDPGCFSTLEEQELKKYILDQDISVKYLINTHCHLDHIFGNNFVWAEFKPQYYIPERDRSLMLNAPTQARLFGLDMEEVKVAKDFLSEEKNLFLGEEEMEFLFTPGHTSGEFCIYFMGSSICFTGDVLFQNSIGRTDLLGGDYQTLINSIRNKLFTLPPDTKIYPGHGNSSTIGEEMQFNPFFH